MTADGADWAEPADAAGRRRAGEALSVRSLQALLAWTGSSAASTARGRKGKYPAEANSSRSRTLCATDHHLRRCDPRTHGGTGAQFTVLCAVLQTAGQPAAR